MGILLPILIFIIMTTLAQRVEQGRRQQKTRDAVRGPREYLQKVETEPKEVTKREAPRLREEVKRPLYSKVDYIETTVSRSKPKISMTRDSVLNGIIMGEILSPPKCKRR